MDALSQSQKKKIQDFFKTKTGKQNDGVKQSCYKQSFCKPRRCNSSDFLQLDCRAFIFNKKKTLKELELLDLRQSYYKYSASKIKQIVTIRLSPQY